MSSVVIRRLDDNTTIELECNEASAMDFTNPVLFQEYTEIMAANAGSSSFESIVFFHEPNDLTQAVFQETDAGEDVVRFDSVKDLLDDLES